jgi:hypothetical protein
VQDFELVKRNVCWFNRDLERSVAMSLKSRSEMPVSILWLFLVVN